MRNWSREQAKVLLQLKRDPASGWDDFVKEFSDFVYSEIRRLGFDYDESMDRFVYVFEKLREKDYRRLRNLSGLRSDSSFPGWLRTTVRNLTLDWLRQQEGRRRLGKEIAALSPLKQRIFELYFYHGSPPSLILEELRRASFDATLLEVLDAIEEILELLTPKKIWRLIARLRERQSSYSDEEESAQQVSSDPTPEQAALERQQKQRLEQALSLLSKEQRFVFLSRYEHGMSLAEVAASANLSVEKADSLLRSARYKLRKELSGFSEDGRSIRPYRSRAS